MAITKLKSALEKEDLTDYQAVPFWSWNNELDEEELVAQIVEMKGAGIGGFIMHARTGLTTEYLGEKWFSCIDACLKKARELHMNAWVYDENGWPSGFVGGKLLEREDFRAQFLEYKVRKSFDKTAFCVYEKTSAGFIRIFGELSDVDEYHTVYLRTSPANTDILNPEVVDAFIQATHEEYYKRFKDSFGKELTGFFTDEPQYYRWGTPYTRMLKKAFKEKYGKDVCDGLAYLFVDDKQGYEFRTQYFTTLSELYVNNFYKRLYDWCEEHGCKLTGHSVEEPSLYTQMWGGGGVMPSYEYEHIPAIDALGRNCYDTELSPKQVGSVAQQLGIKQTLTETFGCAGYDATPMELASVGEYQYFNGVSLMCHHLLPYSMAGQGKVDHPPVFSKQNNWWKQFKTFNDHFTKLGYLVSNTKETYDVGIIHPMRSVYLQYIKSKEGASVEKLETSFTNLLNDLRKKGIRFQLIDETVLQRHGSVSQDGALQVGECRYEKIIVPEMLSVAGSTLELLRAFGGKLLSLGEIAYVDGKKRKAELQSNYTWEELVAEREFAFDCDDGRSGLTSRTGDLGEFLFIKNFSRTEESRIVTKGIASCYQAFDLETFTLNNISDEIVLRGCGSLMLIKSAAAKAEKKKETSQKVTDKFAVTDVGENYFVMDTAAFSRDGVNYTETQSLLAYFETLLRDDYKGKIYVKQTFQLKEKMPLQLILEKNHFTFVRLNGVELSLEENAFDVNFRQADISDAAVVGENELVYCLDYYQHDGVWFALFDPLATESVRNCLYYDTHIENAFLKGDFTVGKNRELSARKRLPKITSALYKNGYPFFMGELTMEGKIEYDGKGERLLSLDKGRFLVAEITVNGVERDMIFDTRLDITPLLKTGENDVQIRLRSSLRNLFGPHHFAPNPEPLGVSPFNFTLRGHWQGAKNAFYTPEYNSVPFGVDEICLIKR